MTWTPVFGWPSGTTVFDATGTPGQEPVLFTITATDNVDADVAIVCSPPSGSSFPARLLECQLHRYGRLRRIRRRHLNVRCRIRCSHRHPPSENVVVEATGPSGAAVTYGQATAVMESAEQLAAAGDVQPALRIDVPAGRHERRLLAGNGCGQPDRHGAVQRDRCRTRRRRRWLPVRCVARSSRAGRPARP